MRIISMNMWNVHTIVKIVAGLIAVTATYTPAQLKINDRPQPLMHSAAGNVPATGRSGREFYKQWRKTQSLNNRKRLGDQRVFQKSSSETVILNEGFEGGAFPPAGWTRVVVAGDPDWSSDSFSPHTGTSCAYSEFSSGPASKKYLITNRVTLNGLLLYRLTFWIQRGFSDPFDPDTVYVKLATADSLPASFTTTLYKCYTGPDLSADPNIYTTVYKQFTVEFSGISGTAWLAFDHEDSLGQSIFLDDVTLDEVVNNDISALSVDEPLAGARKNLGVAFQPKATFKNNGVLTQTGIPVRFKMINALGTAVYNNPQTIASLAPGASVQVTFSSFTPLTPGNYTARALAKNPGDTNPPNDSTDVQCKIPDDVSGLKTVGTGGDFKTLNEAVHYLNDNNVAGPLTFSLISTSYDEPPLAIDNIHYTTSSQPVTFKPSAGISPTVTISATFASPYGLRLKGVENLTFDGSNSGSDTRNVTLVMDTADFSGPALLVTDGCKNITLKNFSVRGFKKSNDGTNSAIVLDSLTADKRDSSVVFDNLWLMRAFNGFYLRGPGVKSFKVKISRCDFGGPGADAITQAGLVAYNMDSLTIAGNNIRQLFRSQGFVDLYGVYLGDGCTNTTISANLIHDIRTTVNSAFAFGIVNGAGTGSNLLCYNNFVYDIASVGSGTSMNFSAGLYSSNASTTGERYYHNSVFLYGRDSSTSTTSFSTGLYIVSGVSSLEVKNNTILNSMTFGGSSADNKGYCVYSAAAAWPGGSISDHNDLYASGPQGVVGYITGNNRNTLSDWQAASSQDGASISADPLFVSPTDLHVQFVSVTSPVNGQAVPLAGVPRDIDNEVRNGSTPDIGADEFTPQFGSTTTISVLQGWNMVSVPTIPSDPRKIVLFPTAVSNAFAYQGSYATRDTLVGTLGYWLKFSSAQDVQIVGLSITRDTVDVADGWNLIGSVGQSIASSSVTSIPSGLVTSQFFGYSGSYTFADTIKPGRGYWVKVSQAGKLILATGTSMAATTDHIRIVPISELPPQPPHDPSGDHTALPASYALEQNFPNPFNPSTLIRYQLPARTHVSLKVYDMIGREVAILADETQEAGYKSVKFYAETLPSGVYFYRLVTGQFVESKKLILMK